MHKSPLKPWALNYCCLCRIKMLVRGCRWDCFICCAKQQRSRWTTPRRQSCLRCKLITSSIQQRRRLASATLMPLLCFESSCNGSSPRAQTRPHAGMAESSGAIANLGPSLQLIGSSHEEAGFVPAPWTAPWKTWALSLCVRATIRGPCT